MCCLHIRLGSKSMQFSEWYADREVCPSYISCFSHTCYLTLPSYSLVVIIIMDGVQFPRYVFSAVLFTYSRLNPKYSLYGTRILFSLRLNKINRTSSKCLCQYSVQHTVHSFSLPSTRANITWQTTAYWSGEIPRSLSDAVTALNTCC
jgi:hypothetical protein